MIRFRLDRSVAGFDDFAGLDAAGADVHALGGTIHEGTHALDIWIPATLGTDMGVRHASTP
jgi:hypothetical protein